MWNSLLLFLTVRASALALNLQDQDDIRSVASTIAYDMMTVYQGNQSGQVPGLLPGGLSCNPNTIGTYCWWEGGAMFGSLINYWQYTGDKTYNDVVSQAIQWQKGSDSNFNPANQSGNIGVGDQGFWALTLMDAVEANFPEAAGAPSWLSLAQTVFDFQVGFWDSKTCGGGFRYQFDSTAAGYHLKSTVANGANFQLAARLAFVTGNSSYADWANKVYDWMSQSTLMQRDSSSDILYIWDNTDTKNNCTDQANFVWSYSYGGILAGAAYMSNYTNGSDLWLGRVQEILNSTYSLFFPTKYGGSIMYELECEEKVDCDEDQKSFKAILTRGLAITALLVPSTAVDIARALSASALGAAGQCDGGTTARACGQQWYTSTPDGTTGVGQQMAALSVVGSTLNRQDIAPRSANNGTNTMSDPKASTTASGLPSSSSTVSTGKSSSTGRLSATAKIAVAIVVPVVVLILLAIIASTLYKRWRKKKQLQPPRSGTAVAGTSQQEKRSTQGAHATGNGKENTAIISDHTSNEYNTTDNNIVDPVVAESFHGHLSSSHGVTSATKSASSSAPPKHTSTSKMERFSDADYAFEPLPESAREIRGI